jgi:hypothetical protein
MPAKGVAHSLTMGVPAHQATTRHLGAVYPFASEAGLGGRGVLIGRDLPGGAFVYDPFELYRSGLLTKVSIKAGFRTARWRSASSTGARSYWAGSRSHSGEVSVPNGTTS